MMIRGRHRGLPYQLDRAIVLPNERLDGYGHEPLERVQDVNGMDVRGLVRIKRFHTS
jgi:hypothetical protein